MSAQDEIKQRLEVAQLYEEMGQLPKATRYYIAAAETALKGKLFDRGRELLHKALQLDPDNAQAKTYLEKLDKHLESLGVAPPRAAQPAGNVRVPAAAAAGSGGVTLPTPALYLRSEQISAILSQVSSAPNPKFFPFTPLPKIDMRAVEEKNRKLEAAREAARAKERTAVESAFGNRSGGFAAGSSSGFLNQVQRTGRRRDKVEEESKEDVSDNSAEGRRRRRAGANQDLADSIRKRLQGG